jgi:hypothetical protein
MKSDKIELLKDYEDFLSGGSVAPPRHCSEDLLKRIHTELKPSFVSTFLKMLGIEIVVGALTTFLCPQFGFGLSTGFSLMDVLMKFGDSVCMFGCGAFFLGACAFVMSLLLNPEEMMLVRRSELLQFAGLTILSIGFFAFVSGGLGLSVMLSWALGAVSGGFLLSRFGWLLRSYFRKRFIYGI